MGTAERKPFLCQIVSHIGGIGEVIFQDGSRTRAVDGHGAQHAGINIQSEPQCVYGVKYAFLVFLHILVIGKRKSFHHGQERRQMSVYPSCFPADQFADIGILLLRHDGTACTVSVIKLNKSEFTGAPQNQFFRQAGQVHHANGCEGKKLDKVVTIGNCVQTVSITF